MTQGQRDQPDARQSVILPKDATFSTLLKLYSTTFSPALPPSSQQTCKTSYLKNTSFIHRIFSYLSTFHLHRVSFPKSHCFAPFHFQSKNSDLRCISYQRRPSREANTGPSFIGTSLHPLNLASVQLMLSLLDQSSSCCYALLFHPYILYSTVKRRNK